MFSYTINVTLDNESKTEHEIVESAVYNQKKEARGYWSIAFDDGKVVWSLTSGTGQP